MGPETCTRSSSFLDGHCAAAYLGLKGMYGRAGTSDAWGISGRKGGMTERGRSHRTETRMGVWGVGRTCSLVSSLFGFGDSTIKKR